MTNPQPLAPEVNEALECLLGRYSVGPKYLAPPAPTAEQLWLAACAALRSPDHGKLAPFRFAVLPPDSRPLLAQLFAEYARRNGKSEAEVSLDRARALRAPVLVAFMVRIAPGPIPAHEQWLAAGGALASFVSALHAMGYGAKMVSGRKVEDEAIAHAFCRPGEKLIGWIAAGTATVSAPRRQNDDPHEVLDIWRPQLPAAVGGHRPFR